MTAQHLAASPPEGFWSQAPPGDLWERGRRYPYAQVWERGSALVEAAGLPTRSLVFLFVDNSFASVSAYLGFLRAGHVVFLGDLALPAQNKAALVERYCPEAVWSGEGGWTPVSQHRAPPAMHPDLALLLSTSGSTGSPKLVRLSYTALQSNAVAICRVLEIDASDCAITSLHMAYAYGLSIINSHVCAGASLVCTNQSVEDPEFWVEVARHRCTSFAGVPFQYDVLREIDYWAAPQPSIRTYTQAGGGLSPAAQRFHFARAESAGARLVVMYGQTEATARISYVPPDRLADHLGTIGSAIPGGHLAIADPDPVSGEGELVYEGPNVMLGYAEGREGLALGDECGGRLRTGDIATRDADGFFRIVGRTKRIVKPFGIRISLDHLEQLVANDIRAPAAVVGDDTYLAVFVRRGSIARDELAAGLVTRTRLPRNCIRVLEIDNFPLTASGKIDYEALRVTAERDAANRPARATRERAPDVAQLCQTWSRLLGVDLVLPNANVFLDLGADSLTALAYLGEVESAYGVPWTLAELLRNPTVADQARAIAAHIERAFPHSPSARPFLQLSATAAQDILFFASPSGHEWVYMHLAKVIPPEHGFHVLRDWRLDAGRFVPQSVNELAGHYVDVLLRLPQTPSILGGWCFGGLLAFEVALRLEAAGRAPKALVLVDTIIRRPSASWVRNHVVRIAWHNARRGNPLGFVPWLRPVLAPPDVGLRLLISLLNVRADYERLPIGPMADFVLGEAHDVDPTKSVADGFPELYEAAYPKVDPLMRERFLVPGINAQTALLHLLVLIGNRLATKHRPSGRTRIPTLFITPSQSPNHGPWRHHAIGEIETVIVDGVESLAQDSNAQAHLLQSHAVSLFAPHDFTAHGNLMQPQAVALFAPRLEGWLERHLAGTSMAAHETVVTP